MEKPIKPLKDIPLRPVAGPARLRKRHLGVLLSFFLVVVVPTVMAGLYLGLVARDQYASTTGFTVRKEENGSASAVMTGLAFLTGQQAGVDGNVLYEFIQSQSIVETVSKQIDLRTHYGAGWPDDPLYSIWPEATIEDLLWLWKRFVRISFDSASGIFHVEVRAFDPETATQIAQLVVGESQNMINDLNEAARRDALSSAEADLQQAIERLRKAREDVATFRAETRIVDPQTDVQARLGVVSNLQQQLAQALVELDLLMPTTRDNDPRRVQVERRIEVIRDRIDAERDSVATGNQGADSNYPQLLARYESLRVDLEFAEQNYTAALAALDGARSAAARRTLYLATFVPPTVAEQSEYPQRITLTAITAALMLMLWSVMVLVYYSLRDRG